MVLIVFELVVENVLPASLMISAIQYTFVERLVSELRTSILTPSSMSPQHVPIGAWNTEAAVKLQQMTKKQIIFQSQISSSFYLHAWNSWLELRLCYCYRCTDPSQKSLLGPLAETMYSVKLEYV